MIQWISLYLSGQYPGHYRLPDRLEVLMKIRQADLAGNFGDSTVLLLKDKGDVEFYNSLLTAFEALHGSDKFQKLLENLKIPEEVRKDPNEYRVEKTNPKPPKIYDALQLNKYIHKDLVSLFSAGIKSDILYRWSYIQAFNIINKRLEKYCNEKLGKEYRTEMDAVNTIFDECSSANSFNMVRWTETEQGMESGLKWLFEWAIKYYRNPSAHQTDYLNTEGEFIEAMFLLSSILRRMENSKID